MKVIELRQSIIHRVNNISNLQRERGESTKAMHGENFTVKVTIFRILVKLFLSFKLFFASKQMIVKKHSAKAVVPLYC